MHGLEYSEALFRKKDLFDLLQLWKCLHCMISPCCCPIPPG
jgi:hypothetical protein